MSIVGFPEKLLPPEVLQQILRGATDKVSEAGISIIGGHTIEDTEPKFGLVVTGSIDPGKILTNSSAKPGDAIILTKPVGTGILSTGIKRGLVDRETEKHMIAIMAQLNNKAAEIMADFSGECMHGRDRVRITGASEGDDHREVTQGPRSIIKKYRSCR